MDQDQVGIFSLEPPHGGGTTMGGAIIHNPEDPVRLPIGLLFHDLLDQPTKRFDAGSGFATAKHLGAPHVPGRHISQRAATLVLKLNAHGFPTLRLGRRPHHMVSGLAQCSYILRPARSLTPFTGAFYTKGFEHFIASMLASAATGCNESCRVGLLYSPTGVLRLCHGAL